jgi:hypothetical protein
MWKHGSGKPRQNGGESVVPGIHFRLLGAQFEIGKLLNMNIILKTVCQPITRFFSVIAVVLMGIFPLNHCLGQSELSFGVEAWNTSLSAIELSPQQSFSFSGLTLQVTDFQDELPIGEQQNSTLELSLAYDSYQYDYSTQQWVDEVQPGATISSATATINSSTGSSYYFDLSGSLQAGVSYWLWIYIQTPDGNEGVHADWDGGQSIQSIGAAGPEEILINGYETAVDGFNSPSTQVNQLVTITSVPEPGTTGLVAVALLIGAVLFKSSRLAQLKKF